MKRAWMAISIVILVAAPVGCKKAEPPISIVKKSRMRDLAICLKQV
jgi:hypothetical protein